MIDQREYCKQYRLNNKEKIRENKKRWRAANKDKIKEANRRFRDRHGEKLKKDKYQWVGENKDKRRIISRRHLLKKYNLTENDYDDMLEKQNYECLICHTKVDGLKEVLHIDHCHKTGKIRGLLCRCCNVAIGLIKEDITIAYAIIDYINNNKDQDNHGITENSPQRSVVSGREEG